MATEKNQNLIDENAEGAELFADLENYYKRNPSAFAFFCSKYQTILYDNFPWADVLFRFDSKPAGMLDKFLPYISFALSLITLIIILIKK